MGEQCLGRQRKGECGDCENRMVLHLARSDIQWE